MNMQKNHAARKATALLSAIAATSLLGLPALAGGSVGAASQGRDQAQAASSSDQMQCTSTVQSNQPSTTAAPDASAASAAQLPNQSDPRAGLSPSNQTVSSTAGLATSESNMDTNKPFSTSNQGAAYSNVLAQGGATAGGFASRQVSAANNPEAYRTVSSRYSSNQDRSNYYRSGSSATGTTDLATNANESMRSDAVNQPSSQSSQTASTTIAQCPGGMTMPPSARPDGRQTPNQPDVDKTTNPQQTSPQQPTGNEAR